MATPSATPELVQFGDLTLEHFRREPVWIGVHTVDYDEPWYEDTDEETFRPWAGERPVDAGEGMLLARARLVLADGTVAAGFATPAPAPGARGEPDLGLMQPHMFLPDGSLTSFWMGMAAEQPEAHARLYRALGRDAKAVFPITFSIEEGLARGVVGGEIEGFYYTSGLGKRPVVRV